MGGHHHIHPEISTNRGTTRCPSQINSSTCWHSLQLTVTYLSAACEGGRTNAKSSWSYPRKEESHYRTRACALVLLGERIGSRPATEVFPPDAGKSWVPKMTQRNVLRRPKHRPICRPTTPGRRKKTFLLHNKGATGNLGVCRYFP